MYRLMLTTALLTLGTGCSSGGGDVWVLYLESADDSGFTRTVDHNFTGASVPDDGPTDDDWTFTSTYEDSGSLAFAQLITSKGENDGYLVYDYVALPGTREGDTWTFTWTGDSVENDREEHSSGFFSARTETDDTTVTVTLTVDGGVASGQVVTNTNRRIRYDETDAWNADAVFTSSDIPAWSYLEGPDGDYVENYSDSAECAGTECFLEIVDSGSRTQAFTGERTTLSDDAMVYMGDVTSP
jgi:hypothetical protein